MHWRWFPSLVFAAALVAGASETPPMGPPEGIEVQARGPVHEAFASPTSDPIATRLVPKKPPKAIEELPPEQKPEGDAIWISGYWAYDDDARDFLWVSGVWRRPPAGKNWVAGYWREEGTSYQWVPGFWTTAPKEDRQNITYLPPPPEPPVTVAPGKPPIAEAFFVPGCWVWRGNAYAWRAGYWARTQPGYVWIADHYRWTPTGCLFVEGYWDLALPRRGILYAPVIIRPTVISAGFVYTPTYAVNDTVIVSAMFVRPSVTHYYFGDYYGATYTDLGFESCVVYSRRRYEPVIVYESYYRRDPNWLNIQINLYNDRCAGRAPVPPRTLVQQNTFVQNNITNVTQINNITMIAPPAQVAARKETKLVALDTGTRNAAKTQALNVQSISSQRARTEVKTPPGSLRIARTGTMAVPRTEPVKSGMIIEKATTSSLPTGSSGAKLGTPSVKSPMVSPPTVTGPSTGSKATPPSIPTRPPSTSEPTTSPPIAPKMPPTVTPPAVAPAAPNPQPSPPAGVPRPPRTPTIPPKGLPKTPPPKSPTDKDKKG